VYKNAIHNPGYGVFIFNTFLQNALVM